MWLHDKMNADKESGTEGAYDCEVAWTEKKGRRCVPVILGFAMLLSPGDFPSVRAAGEEKAERAGTRQVEALDRGVIAVKVNDGVYLSWRYLGTDAQNTSFEIYRDGAKVTQAPICDRTNYKDPEGTLDSVCTVHMLVNNIETERRYPRRGALYAVYGL